MSSVESIVCPNSDENLRNSEGAVIDLRDGSLLLAWTRFRCGSSSDFAPSDIVTSMSTDGGRRWSDPLNTGSIWWVNYDVHFVVVNPANLSSLRLTSRYQHAGATFLTLNLTGLPGTEHVQHRVAPTHFWTDTFLTHAQSE